MAMVSENPNPSTSKYVWNVIPGRKRHVHPGVDSSGSPPVGRRSRPTE